jgi:hypothetical protein
MNELAEVCRELRQIAEAMPAGPERARLEADLSRLYARLSALPARVAARAAMKSRAEVRAVLDEEFADAFSGIMAWLN